MFEEGEEAWFEHEHRNDSEDEDANEEVPPVISSILNKPRNTPTWNLIENVSSDLAKSPAIERARLLPIINASPKTPNSHLERLYQLNTRIAENQMQIFSGRNAIAIKRTAVLPFTMPGNTYLRFIIEYLIAYLGRTSRY